MIRYSFSIHFLFITTLELLDTRLLVLVKKVNNFKNKDSRITIFMLHPQMKSEKIETFFLKVHEVKRSEIMGIHTNFEQKY